MKLKEEKRKKRGEKRESENKREAKQVSTVDFCLLTWHCDSYKLQI